MSYSHLLNEKKMNNEKLTIRKMRKIRFPSNKMFLFSFLFSLWTPPTFKPHNFLISYSLEMI